jgi:hypothetical protein
MEQTISLEFEKIVAVLRLLDSSLEVNEFRTCGFDIQRHDYHSFNQ